MPEPVEGTFSILISVPERSRRHIISIVLKYVCSIEHLWCSFENSKTPSFQQISVNFVILKQIQKIYTQWLRELRSQTFSLCSATKPFITRCLSLSKARSQFSSRCLSLSKAHYFYCIKIRVLSRTSLMFLWELKNAIISQNLRELCVIKINTNIPHIVASTSSATNYFITRCLSLSKAHSNF